MPKTDSQRLMIPLFRTAKLFTQTLSGPDLNADILDRI